jgi:hypothetical protein
MAAFSALDFENSQRRRKPISCDAKEIVLRDPIDDWNFEGYEEEFIDYVMSSDNNRYEITFCEDCRCFERTVYIDEETTKDDEQSRFEANLTSLWECFCVVKEEE